MKHGESIFAWLWFVVYCLLLFWAAVQSTELEVKYRVTAYCPCEKCCGKFADGITASGHVIKPGDKFVAAPKSIPFGTVLDVPGYGIVKVEDRGGAIKDGRLDVFFGDKISSA